MARPLKQGMDYFPHDTDACSDEKIEALRMLHGNDGYAFYFILLERIYRTPDFELDVSDAETIQILARKVEVTKEKFAEMLQTALKRRCFCPDAYQKRQVLTSPGILKRSASVVSKRQKMVSAYQNRVSDAETPPETPPETPVSAEFPLREKESKGKESKGKENKENKKGVKTPEVCERFEQFWETYGKKEDHKKCLDYWQKLTPSEQETVLTHAPAYVKTKPDVQFRKYPLTYLNGEVWKEPVPHHVNGSTIKQMVY